MILTHPHGPLESLRQLASLYPDMRFGQLMIMAATLASDTTPLEVSSITDDELTTAITEHVQRRRIALGVPLNSLPAPDRDKGQLLQSLQVKLASTNLPLGQLIATMAESIGCPLYDIEDRELAAEVQRIASRPPNHLTT